MNKPLMAWKGIEKEEAELLMDRLQKNYVMSVSIVKAVSGKWNVYYSTMPGIKIEHDEVVKYCKEVLEV